MNIFLIHRMHEENKKSPLTWHQSKYSSARKRAAEDLDGSDNEEKGVWSDWHHETRQPGSSLNIHLELQDCEHFTILNQNHRTYMRDRGKKKDGQRNVLPPQIFNGDDYIGVRKKKEKVFYHPDLRAHLQQDFEDFDLANEDDMLEEFLGIERENPKVLFSAEQFTADISRWSRTKRVQWLPRRRKGWLGSCRRRGFRLWRRKKFG